METETKFHRTQNPRTSYIPKKNIESQPRYIQTESNTINNEEFYRFSKGGLRNRAERFGQTFNIKNCNDWGKNIREYSEGKKSLKWGKNPTPEIIHANDIRAIDSSFNPIVQKYKDEKIDKEIRESDQKNLVNQLSNFYDRELTMTQTYNIINLRDKLKYFISHEKYPEDKPKNLFTSERNPSKQNYNIISNISLSQHHYDKPENRKNIPPGEIDPFIVKPKAKEINIREFKDYDIITNKYNFKDNEKSKIDIEINKLKGAKDFYKERDYDIIRCVYYEPEKEAKFKLEQKIKNEKLLKTKRECLFNPFNNIVYDEENLKLQDMMNKNARLRYTIKPQIEKYYHQNDLNLDTIYDKRLKNKLFYNRFKSMDKRGYDLFSGQEKFNNYKNSIDCRGKNDPWEILKKGVDPKNETLSKKKIYKSSYDKSDVDKNNIAFRKIRKKMLDNLPSFSEEPIFSTKEYQHKINYKTIQQDNIKSVNKMTKNLFKANKTEWFASKKNVNMKEN